MGNLGNNISNNSFRHRIKNCQMDFLEPLNPPNPNRRIYLDILKIGIEPCPKTRPDKITEQNDFLSLCVERYYVLPGDICH